MDWTSTMNDIELIYQYYITEFGVNPNRYKLSEGRKRKIKVRLKDAGVDLLKEAIYNTSISPFHTGENSRGWKADLDWILTSYEKVERLANMDVLVDAPDFRGKIYG